MNKKIARNILLVGSAILMSVVLPFSLVSAAAAPTTATQAANNITQTSAQFNATVNPNGESTVVWFE